MTDKPVPDDLRELLDLPEVVELFDESQPVDTRALSKEDRQRVIGWLNARQKNHSCPVCETNRWTVGGHVLHGQIASKADAGLLIGGTNYPMVFVVCDNCFYVRQFMAVPMGLDFFKSEKPDA